MSFKGAQPCSCRTLVRAACIRGRSLAKGQFCMLNQPRNLRQARSSSDTAVHTTHTRDTQTLSDGPDKSRPLTIGPVCRSLQETGDKVLGYGPPWTPKRLIYYFPVVAHICRLNLLIQKVSERLSDQTGSLLTWVSAQMSP